MNHHEYRSVQHTRKTLLDFCRDLKEEDFTNENDFGWGSIRHTLVHTADCYHAWLGSFLLLKTKNPLTPKNKIRDVTLDEIINRFCQADDYVKEVLDHFAGGMEEPLFRKIPWWDEGDPISMTPGKLLFHVVTHEYHHKGQVMAMVRQLGFKPPNTDVLGTPD
ncbi:DinB family protein [Rossellomorea marisflavi]|uniref:DinB family protein n=1 Tax=Rossellomorea marisflavi TaxID=189381 RepID=UPI0011E66859|nr:DinB family protein [Rossellomorea marisflavi]TYO68843.1 DUF664 domain-containing protein [Rossellomorea marisflavi]